jgi:hypothetical protein
MRNGLINMKKALLLLLSSLIATDLLPQQDKTEPAGLNFGIDPPGSDPARFFPEILASENCPHGQLAFSTDGRTVFWSAIIQDGPEQTIFFSRFDGKTFSKPEVAPFAADSGFGGPAFSADGKRLFFSVELPSAGSSARRPTAICYVEKKDSDWSSPIPIDVTVDTLMTKGQVSVSRTGNIYFSGRMFTEQSPSIFICRYTNGKYMVPEKLRGPLVSEQLLCDPWIDPDEKFLLVTCPPKEGSPMPTDIGISFIQKDGGWSLPLRFDGEVNTPAFERFPALSRDGRYLFFIRSYSQRFVGDQAYFYWVSPKIIEELKPE